MAYFLSSKPRPLYREEEKRAKSEENKSTQQRSVDLEQQERDKEDESLNP